MSARTIDLSLQPYRHQQSSHQPLSKPYCRVVLQTKTGKRSRERAIFDGDGIGSAAVLSVVTLSVPPLTLAVPASFTSRTERVTSASSVLNVTSLNLHGVEGLIRILND